MELKLQLNKDQTLINLATSWCVEKDLFSVVYFILCSK